MSFFVDWIPELELFGRLVQGHSEYLLQSSVGNFLPLSREEAIGSALRDEAGLWLSHRVRGHGVTGVNTESFQRGSGQPKFNDVVRFVPEAG